MPLPLIMAEGLNLSQHQSIDAVDSANASYRLLPCDRVATVGIKQVDLNSEVNTS